MKIYKLLLIFAFALGFFLVGRQLAQATFAPFRPLCIGISGKFSANSTWKGGSIQVGCVGDNGLAVPQSRRQEEACLGEVQTVNPGQSFRLTKCSCLGDEGCLKIGKELRLEPLVDGKRKITVVKRIDEMPTFIENSCRINKTGDMCGTNGQHITGYVKITCAVPTPTPRPSATPTPKPSPKPSVTPGVSLTPSPSACPAPNKVTNVKVTCPNCFATPSETPTN